MNPTITEEEGRWLTEDILKECWHEPIQEDEGQCQKCGLSVNGTEYGSEYIPDYRRDFPTWSVFGLLWEAAKKEKWWNLFIFYLWQLADYDADLRRLDPLLLPTVFIDPIPFSKALYAFGQKRSELVNEATS